MSEARCENIKRVAYGLGVAGVEKNDAKSTGSISEVRKTIIGIEAYILKSPQRTCPQDEIARPRECYQLHQSPLKE